MKLKQSPKKKKSSIEEKKKEENSRIINLSIELQEMTWIEKERIHEIIKFILVGGINTFNYYVVYLFLLKLIDINYLVSHISGFVVSFIVSYYLNCYFVYKVKPTWRKFIQFPLTQVVNMGMQTILLYIFVQWFHISSVIAPFAGLIITIPITFVLSKYILRD